MGEGMMRMKALILKVLAMVRQGLHPHLHVLESSAQISRRTTQCGGRGCGIGWPRPASLRSSWIIARGFAILGSSCSTSWCLGCLVLYFVRYSIPSPEDSHEHDIYDPPRRQE